MPSVVPLALLLCSALRPEFALEPAPSAMQGWSRVARVEAAAGRNQPAVVSGSRYVYSAVEVPAESVPIGARERTVLFGNTVRLRFLGLDPAASYRIHGVFLSDSDTRVMRLQAGPAVLESSLPLPADVVLHRSWDLPTHAYANGELEVRLIRLEGPNAVVSALEVWSTDPTPLATPKPLSEVLAGIHLPRPRLTPVPAAVAGVSSPVLSLDGEWRFSPTPGEPEGAPQAQEWYPIQVPGEWAMQGFSVPTGQATLYEREFIVPVDWRGGRLRLRFDAVHSACEVWLNGAPAGGHEGGFVPFDLDVTDHVRAGRNLVTVRVTGETLSDALASATQYAAHPLGGITRKVQLFVVPNVHVAEQTIDTDFGSDYRDANLRVRLGIANDGSATPTGGAVSVSLTDPAGRTVRLSTDRCSIELPSPGHSVTTEITSRVERPAKWDPEHPNLYTLTTALYVDGRLAQTLVRRVGFRHIRVSGNRLLLNGRPVRLRGVNRHEAHPLRGRSLTPELCRRDAELFRAANCNFVRTSHYPPSEEFLDACDELGLMVECEAALCWVSHGANPVWGEWDALDPRVLPYLAAANLENIAANRHHPSVIIWSLANESAWSPLWARVLEEVHAADTTRPASFHDQCWGPPPEAMSTADIAVYHYPDEGGPELCDASSRPVLFGEYCHIQTYNRRELVTDPGIRDDWGRPFARMYDLMWRHSGCLGGAIWSGIDDSFHLPDGRIVGYGPWGIVDGWRREKPEYWHVRKAYSPVRVLASAVPLPTGTELRVPVENRYDFTDLREVGIRWLLGDERGTTRARAAPHTRGELVIRPRRAPTAGQTLRLEFTDPRGFLCETEDLLIGERVTEPAAPEATGTVELSRRTSGYLVRAGDIVWTVDRATGIVKARCGGRDVLVGGPALMILPLTADSGGPGGNDYQNRIEPFTPVLSDWQVASVSGAKREDGSVQIRVEATCTEAEGAYSLSVKPCGRCDLTYDFTMLREVNPRQWGVVLYTPRACDTLSWHRAGLWTVYPEDHIGRLRGRAQARDTDSGVVEEHGLAPTGPWFLDSSRLGTNDFRATRTGIIAASLTYADGTGLHVESDGQQAIRAFVDGGRIGLLIADYATGGADPFFSSHYASDRRPLRAGDRVAGLVRLRLGR